MAGAHVPYRVGREGRARSSASTWPASARGRRSCAASATTARWPTTTASPSPPTPANRVLFPKPEHYDPEPFRKRRGSARSRRAHQRASAGCSPPSTKAGPNEKYDANWADFPGNSEGYADGDWATRDRIAAPGARLLPEPALLPPERSRAARGVPRRSADVGPAEGRVRRQRPLAFPALRPRGAPDGRALRALRGRPDAGPLEARRHRDRQLRRRLPRRAAPAAKTAGSCPSTRAHVALQQLRHPLRAASCRPSSRICWCPSAAPPRTSPIARCAWSRFT